MGIKIPQTPQSVASRAQGSRALGASQARGPRPLPRFTRVAAAVASGMGHAHVHGKPGPANPNGRARSGLRRLRLGDVHAGTP